MRSMKLNLMMVLVFTASAQAEPLSRATAVATALYANVDVRKSQESMSLLEGRVREARADALPDVTLLGSGTRYRDPSLLNSSAFDSFPPELRDALKPVAADLYEGTLQVRQTVWSFKLAKAVRAARFGVSFGQEQIRRAQQAVALETIRAYNNYLLSLEKVKVTEKSVNLKERHYEMAKNRRAAGVATDLDVLRSGVDLENQRAQLERIRGEAGLALGELNAAMLRPIDDPVEPTDTLAYEPLQVELAEVVRAALENRPDMKGAALSEKVHGQFVGVAQADSRPRIDFTASWGYSVRKPENFFNNDFQKWSAAITVTVPLFDGYRTSGRVAQAVAERAKAHLDLIDLENRIQLEAKDAVDRLNVASRVLGAAELNVEQAQKALDLTQANYSHGAATTLDVMDAQAALTLAESIRIEALYEHADARATVRYVMGADPLGVHAVPQSLSSTQE